MNNRLPNSAAADLFIGKGVQAILSSDKIRLSRRKEKKSIKLSPRSLRSTSPRNKSPRNGFQKFLFNHENNVDEEVIDHPNMFVYGSQPLGGWNDNLDVATANHFSNASMRPRTCARKKLGSGGLPHMTRPSTTPIRHADTKLAAGAATVSSSENESKSSPAVSRRKSVKIYGRPRTGVPRDRLSYKQASLMFQIDDEGDSYKYDHLSRHSNNNKNAVLQHFIEHRRALENKATERQQLQAAKKYLRKKYDRICIQGEKNTLSFRRKPILSKHEKKRRQRMEGHEFKRRDHATLKKYGNSMVPQHLQRESYNSYYSPIKAQRNSGHEYSSNYADGTQPSPYKTYESFTTPKPSSRGQLVRAKLVPAFIRHQPEAPPPDLKERPLRRVRSRQANRIPVGFRDKVGHFVDPKFNPNDRNYGQNVEGLIDSIMGIPVGLERVH